MFSVTASPLGLSSLKINSFTQVQVVFIVVTVVPPGVNDPSWLTLPYTFPDVELPTLHIDVVDNRQHIFTPLNALW